jgi:hypothetical protein
MLGKPDDKALGALAGDRCRTGLASFTEQTGSLHVQPRLGGCLVVAGHTVAPQKGVHVSEIILLSARGSGAKTKERRTEKTEPKF